MTDAELPGSSAPDASDGGPDGRLSTTGVLAGACRRLAGNPRALAAMLLAGVVVAGVDWLRLHDPIPTTGYEGVQSGRVAFPFGVAVSVLSRTSVPASALLHLETGWLAATVGLELLSAATVVAASSYALARLLDVRLSLPAVLRYGAVVAFVRYGMVRANFEGEAVLVGIPLFVAALLVTVRLVPFPGRIVRGETVGTALRRSWAATRGHGWSLFGVVLVVGLANHALASVPVVGPVGSAAAGAVHAGAVATVIEYLREPA